MKFAVSAEHPAHQPHQPHQFSLIGQRRFGPIFWTVFLGAVNDNLLKFAIVLLLTYHVQVPWMPPAVVGSALGGIFILPSVLLSATAGQWADKVDLAWLMRLAKSAEVLMMALAAYALWQQQAALLVLSVLLSGLHVTLFATVKYAYVPRHLAPYELTGGNGVLEMGTFTAILLGTVLGGVLMSPMAGGMGPLMLAIVLLALLGRWKAQGIPATPALSPQLKMGWNPLAETWRNLDRIHHQPVLFLSLLGISWMWFFGAVFFSLFPLLAKTVLHAPEDLASLLLVLTSLGVAAGALLCERLSAVHEGDAPDLGLVLAGALGMGVFALDLAWVVQGMAQDPTMQALKSYNWQTFASHPSHWRALLDQTLMAMSIGLFSVPLYAQMQHRAEPERRARIVAANNILNALFILVCALMTGVLTSVGLDVGQVFAVSAVLHLLVMGVTLWWQPILWQHSVAWLRRLRAGGADSA